jgi:hypothetical protein
MLRPFLIVGVGGSGGKTLRAVRYALDLRLRVAGWEEGIPDAWQFLHIDTPLVQDGADFPAPFLPHDSYIGLVPAGAKYSNVVNSINAKLAGKNKEEINRQFPDPDKVAVPIHLGAGQYRGVGRTVAIAQLGAIAGAAQAAFNRLKKPDSMSQLQRLGKVLGADLKQGSQTDPVFIMVSSVAGGSGAGQYLDVVESIKAQFGGAPWSLESYGILYAPDVFDGIKGASGIPRNALATISETVNGYWNNVPNSSTMDLFQAAGLQLGSGGALDRTGVRYPFIVGRQGQNASFAGQSDIYLAIATTLAAWMTDDKFQDTIGTYASGNWQTAALSTADHTPFRKQDALGPVACAIGFGRVTLAREKFVEYAAERFARACVDRILKAHTESDPHFLIMEEDAHVQDIAQKNEIAFFHASGMHELNDDRGENNQVIDALRPQDELSQLASELKFEVASKTAVGLDKNGGLDIDTWHARIIQIRTDLLPKALKKERELRQDRMTLWTQEIQNTFPGTVASFIADYGLRVTEELVHRLSVSVTRSADQLRGESANYREYLNHISSYVYEELRTAGEGSSLRPDSDAVQHALTKIEDSFLWESEAELRETAAKLLVEIQKEFLNPLRQFLSSTFDALSASVVGTERADGRDNDYPFWPERNSSAVAKKYEPSSNEKMLLEVDEFSDEFERLVTTSTEQNRFMDAILEVMNQQLSDFDGHDLVSVVQTWVPTTSADPTMMGIKGKKPQFSMDNNVEDYLLRATEWMSQRGTPFYAFITQNLKDYLDTSLPPADYAKREARFLSHIKTAFKAAGPLVLLDSGLLGDTHDLSVGQDDRVIVSALPFGKNDPVYSQLHSFLVQEFSKIPSSVTGQSTNIKAEVDKFFRDQNVDSIEFFSMQGYPVQPLVMSSMMKPIAAAWQSQSTNEFGRGEFWRWARARLLPAAVPMDNEAFKSILRGYFVSQFMGVLHKELDNDLGPKFEVELQNGSRVSFPHPLLHVGKLKTIDESAAIMESSIIATALCSAYGNLRPLDAYARLRELGGEDSGLSAELEALIRDTSDSAVDPSDATALFERKKIGIQWFDDQLQKFDTDLGQSMATKSVYEYPTVWEIQDEVREALKTLRGLVSGLEAAESGMAKSAYGKK